MTPPRFDLAIEWMDRSHRVIAGTIDPPTPSFIAGLGVHYRYGNRSAQQAIVQKIAFMVSGLRAANLLLNAGYVTEQAILCRAVNEAQEDITFLVLAMVDNSNPPLLSKYLDSFFAEDATRDALARGLHPKGRPIPSRKEIQNYTARHNMFGTDDPHGAVGQSLAIGHVLSSFTHGASPSIMQLYNPASRAFFTAGIPDDSSIIAAHIDDFENYIFRGLIAVAMAAKIIAPTDFAQQCFEEIKQYESHFFAKNEVRPG